MTGLIQYNDYVYKTIFYNPRLSKMSYHIYSSIGCMVFSLLIAFLAFFLISKRMKTRKIERMNKVCNQRHQQNRLNAAQIESRASLLNNNVDDINLVTINRYLSSTKKIEYNLGNRDFFSFSDLSKGSIVYKDVLNKYGCGSCGPRSFYGTMSVHKCLEDKMKKWLNSEDALAYSGWKQAVMSLPHTFANGKQHIIIYDEAIRFPALDSIQRFAQSTSSSFLHNDMTDLENKIQTLDSKIPKKMKDITRKFIYVEGVYLNRGTICLFEQVVNLAKKYNYRIILDDTLGFGFLGENGKGILEHYNLLSNWKNNHICAVVIGLDSCLGANGAVCLGDKENIRYQHTGAAGFIFSASLPPFYAATATNSLNQIIKNPKEHKDKIKIILTSTNMFVLAFQQIFEPQINNHVDYSIIYTPIFHIYALEDSQLTLHIEKARLFLNPDRYKVMENTLEYISKKIEEEFSVRIPRIIHSKRTYPPSLRLTIGLGNVPKDSETHFQWWKTILLKMKNHLNTFKL